MLTITYKHFQATINPVGAELSSLKVNQTEHLWHGDEKYWSGRAPVLFPIVGALKNDHMIYQGLRYEMPRHGIARRATFDCIAHSTSAVSLRLQSDEKSLQQYPWQFELRVHFCLNESGLDISYEVINNDEKPMLFTLGSHPAFALNCKNPTELSEYTVAVDQTEPLECYKLDSAGLLATTAEPHNSVFSLSETIFNDDALVFRNIAARSISLHYKDNAVLTVDTDGAPHLGIWSKPGAPFVCIEPWLGTSDFIDSDNQFENKPDLSTLASGETYHHRIGVTFSLPVV